MQYTMLAVVLLPAALAALCPCPPSAPSSEGSPVCGSNNLTYASECALQCAGLPGLVAAHPGPCAVAVMEFPEWSKCHIERQCGSPHDGNCSECDAEDLKCRTLCGWNCACRCMGWATGGLDADSHERWDKCYEEKGCTLSKREACQKNCGSSESCKNLCIMDRERCSCGCIQHAAASRTSTTSAPTATTATEGGTSTR